MKKEKIIQKETKLAKDEAFPHKAGTASNTLDSTSIEELKIVFRINFLIA
ncbi:MAG: hypothetical protein HRU19_23325 [Pseudobacteriovorax sp.]|nr:hypothetical protein [Pseudobacteriovorax sp.]